MGAPMKPRTLLLPLLLSLALVAGVAVGGYRVGSADGHAAGGRDVYQKGLEDGGDVVRGIEEQRRARLVESFDAERAEWKKLCADTMRAYTAANERLMRERDQLRARLKD